MEEGNQEDMYVFKADEADGEFRRVGGHRIQIIPPPPPSPLIRRWIGAREFSFSLSFLLQRFGKDSTSGEEIIFSPVEWPGLEVVWPGCDPARV
jgi:hypothetical protein